MNTVSVVLLEIVLAPSSSPGLGEGEAAGDSALGIGCHT
jgi:hypothetical protein